MSLRAFPQYLLGLLFALIGGLLIRLLMMKIKPGKSSPNFSYKELGVPDDASPEILANIDALVANILEPLRKLMGNRVVVKSGYRSPEKNAAVGGVKNSQHMKGQAADIQVIDKEGKRIDPLIVYNTIKDNLKYDQLIRYLPGAKGYPRGGVHVSYSRTKNRMQLITKTA